MPASVGVLHQLRVGQAAHLEGGEQRVEPQVHITQREARGEPQFQRVNFGDITLIHQTEFARAIFVIKLIEFFRAELFIRQFVE